MDPRTEKASLIVVGAVSLIAGLIFGLIGSNLTTTVNSCTSTFWCSLGASVDGSNLTADYELALVMETFGAALAIIGIIAIAYGFAFKPKPKATELSKSAVSSIQTLSLNRTTSEIPKRYCINCGSDLPF